MSGEKKDGTAETLRGVVAIVIVGLALGLAFNALGLASKPPRGLSWITRVEKMPSLEELQPGSFRVPAQEPRPAAPWFSLVGTAWAQEAVVLAAAADTSHAGAKRTPAAKKAPARKVPVKSVKKPVPVPKSVTRVPVAAPAAAPAAAKVDLPVVPDLDQPIEVKLAFAKRFFDAGPGAAVFVDAREASEYAEGHIAGALSVPFDDAVRSPALIEPFKKTGKPLILYCSGGDCELSKDLAKNMVAEGIRKVLVFTDGMPAWKAAGYPMETGAAKVVR
jgi:rhodanese-related sulfurtransferase